MKSEKDEFLLNKPLVSVVIPNYNYARYLTETLQSVIQQTYQNIEVIVVDDGSTDNSIEVIEALAKEDPRIKLVAKKNGGLSSARNAGIRNCSGDYIAFLDSDDKWEPGKISSQIKALKVFSCDVVFSDYKFYRNDVLENRPEFEFKERLSVTDFIGSNPVLGSASSILMKKEVVAKTGFFDENLNSVEDLDYWTRIAINGFSFQFVNEKDVILRLHPVSMVNNSLKMHMNHSQVLLKQLELIKLSSINININEFNLEIEKRLNRLHWYMIESKSWRCAMSHAFLILRIRGFNSLFLKHRYVFKYFLKFLFTK